MALPQQSHRMTEADYLVFEREQEIKHEYLDGDVFAMTGASANHNLICAYTTAALIHAMGDSPCRVYASDMRVKVEATGLFAYPDLSILCGEPQFLDDTFDTLLNPQVIIEVLSPSTEAYDRGRKFQHYRQIPALQEYLLIAQSSPRIERYLRQDANNWLYTDAAGIESHIELTSIGCTLSLAEVYRKVDFPPEEQ